MIKYERTLTIHLETPKEIALHAEALQVAIERNAMPRASIKQLERARRELALGAKSITLSKAECDAVIDVLGSIEEIAGERLAEFGRIASKSARNDLDKRRWMALESQAAFANLMEDPDRSIGVAP